MQQTSGEIADETASLRLPAHSMKCFLRLVTNGFRVLPGASRMKRRGVFEILGPGSLSTFLVDILGNAALKILLNIFSSCKYIVNIDSSTNLVSSAELRLD